MSFQFRWKFYWNILFSLLLFKKKDIQLKIYILNRNVSHSCQWKEHKFSIITCIAMISHNVMMCVIASIDLCYMILCPGVVRLREIYQKYIQHIKNIIKKYNKTLSVTKSMFCMIYSIRTISEPSIVLLHKFHFNQFFQEL